MRLVAAHDLNRFYDNVLSYDAPGERLLAETQLQYFFQGRRFHVHCHPAGIVEQAVIEEKDVPGLLFNGTENFFKWRIPFRQGYILGIAPGTYL